jgi:hypothetical protein
VDARVFASKHLIADLQDLLEKLGLATGLCRRRADAVQMRRRCCDCRHESDWRAICLAQSKARAAFQHCQLAGASRKRQMRKCKQCTRCQSGAAIDDEEGVGARRQQCRRRRSEPRARKSEHVQRAKRLVLIRLVTSSSPAT